MSGAKSRVYYREANLQKGCLSLIAAKPCVLMNKGKEVHFTD